MFYGFEPVYDKNSKVLILGSFPSVKSRQQGFYYGNKQNRFWKMLETVFEEKIEDDIESKKKFLLSHNIALYDVVEQSNLEGSADLSLEKSNFKTAQLSFLPATQISKIICNGKTAFKLLPSLPNGVPVLCLPSTSSANPRFDMESWHKELRFLKK